MRFTNKTWVMDSILSGGSGIPINCTDVKNLPDMPEYHCREGDKVWTPMDRVTKIEYAKFLGGARKKPPKKSRTKRSPQGPMLNF